MTASRSRSILRSAFASLALAATLSVLGAAVSAQQPPAAEAGVRAAIDEMWTALGAQDEKRFTAATAPDWVLVSARGARLTASQLLGMHKERIKGFVLTASNVRVQVQGDQAWATYDAEMSAQAQGQPWGGRFVVTNVFVRRGSTWVCTHAHETRVVTN